MKNTMNNVMNKIVILMGGVGSRLGCGACGVSSKIFFPTQHGLVLDSIIKCVNEIKELAAVPIEFYLCNNDQKQDLLRYQSRIKHEFSVHVVSKDAHLFSTIHGGESVLVIYGDTFFQKNVLKDIVSAYLSNGLSAVSLLPTDNGIDNVDFVIENNKIINVIPCEKQLFEPTQVFLFSATVTQKIEELVKKSINRFDIMYKYIFPEYTFNVVRCCNNECININEQKDLDKIKA